MFETNVVLAIFFIVGSLMISYDKNQAGDFSCANKLLNFIGIFGLKQAFRFAFRFGVSKCT
ncbi:MAG: hypothetical protein GWO15_02670 [Nitrosopumilaceae archaeon]|nr:hypothetical protein [Nitrosopumilaceae archaeon]